MFAVQQPLAASALGEAMGEPAWKSTVVEVKSNHLPMVSHPDEVVKLIKAAVETIERTESLTSISR